MSRRSCRAGHNKQATYGPVTIIVYIIQTINTYIYDTAGNTHDLEQHESTTSTNVPIYTLLLAGIDTKGESEKSKYILMVLPTH